jgi:soluble lytic murein transglycosylase-like protein
MKLGFLLALTVAAAAAQDPESIARQRAAIERQRAAVQRQVPANKRPTAAFFTVAWTEPLSQAPVEAPCEPVPKDQIDSIVKEMAQREGLTPDLLRAVIEKESSYLPCAVSSAGAEGLMQLMPETAADLGVEDPFNPRQNVDGGAKYLREMIDRYGGNLLLGLAAYNAGPTRADKTDSLPLPAETTNYIWDILQKLGQPEGPP